MENCYNFLLSCLQFWLFLLKDCYPKEPRFYKNSLTAEQKNDAVNKKLYIFTFNSWITDCLNTEISSSNSKKEAPLALISSTLMIPP